MELSLLYLSKLETMQVSDTEHLYQVSFEYLSSNITAVPSVPKLAASTMSMVHKANDSRFHDMT